ncbi:PDR/VanB family oxidoreductase [Cupriavidus nantongensis]
MSTTPHPPVATRVRSIRIEADGIRSFELWPVTGTLSESEAGAHVDVHLPGGLTRQYSLINPGESHRYIIAVNRDPSSRGGSRYLHEQVQVGDELLIGLPRNHFPLNEAAPHSVLIAGGIGVTPLLAMARRLSRLGRSWTFYYCARTRARAAFLEALAQLAGQAADGTLHCVFDGEPGQAALELAPVVGKHAGADFYCCGPSPLLDAFTEACTAIAPERVHVEFFGAARNAQDGSVAQQAARPFQVVLNSSGRTLDVPADRSLLDVLLEHGLPVFSSCREGICGSCETQVLAGEPDHHDRVLTPQERAAGRTMMVCVSRCKGESLVLAL